MVEAALSSPLAKMQIYPAGALVVQEESPSHALGIILEGLLQAANGDAVMRTLTQGDVFGVAGLWEDSTEQPSEITALKKSRVLFLPRELLLQLMSQEPAITQNYLEFTSGRIRYLNQLIGEYTGGNAECRLAAFLCRAAAEQKSASPTIDYSMSKLAQALNIGRTSLYRALNNLTEEGLISKSNKQIVILEPGLLQKKNK